MSIISHAQNFEDVMLYRALKDIEQGFYIDVGANDPEVDSVTKAFYDRGWRGINVEPVAEWFEKLQQQRPRDINLQVAVGAEKGEVALYEIPQTGLSTTDENIADRHKRERGYEISTRQVPLQTLTEICRQYHVAPIHFLKIDVEGGEKAVLEGMDFKNIRPWIIVIESTLPNTQTEDYQEWEQQLLSAAYQFAYFDGLNRFYCAVEHSDLIKHYQSPPNFFDGFQLAEGVSFCGAVVTDKKQIIEQLQSKLDVSELHLAEKEQLLNTKIAELKQLHAHSQWLQNEWDVARAKIDELNQSSHHWWTVADDLNQQLQMVYRSKSWRITWPLRKLMQLLKWLVRCPVRLVNGLIRLPKRGGRWLLAKVIDFVLKRNRLKQRVHKWLTRHPQLEAHLRAFKRARGLIHTPAPMTPATVEARDSAIDETREETKQEQAITANKDDFSMLTPRARQIYADLKAAMQREVA